MGMSPLQYLLTLPCDDHMYSTLLWQFSLAVLQSKMLLLFLTSPNYHYASQQFQLHCFMLLPNCNSEICTCNFDPFSSTHSIHNALAIPSMNILVSLEGQINLLLTAAY
jgi:hypothetical protein